MAEGGQMREHWDRLARDDPYYFVDSRLEYGHPDTERFWAGGREDLTHLLEAVGASLEGSGRVVEVGCGLGRLTRVIAESAAEVLAFDVSPEMIRRATELNPALANVAWRVGDGASFGGVDDGSVDAVVSHVVFQHIPDPAITLAYVRDMGRVLKPGGWAAFQVSNDPSVHQPRSARRGLLGLLRRSEPPRSVVENPAWLGSAIDLDDLRGTADEAGMDVENVVGEGTQYCGVLLRRRMGE
jgi:SAM-dependent methyltransferase